MAQTSWMRVDGADMREGSCSHSAPLAEGVVCAFTGEVQAPPGITARTIETICSLRKDRQEHFPGSLGADSSWDILLQLYAAHLDQYRLNISKLTRETGAPGTTVLRALGVLAAAGLITRHEDRLDRRRVFVELSSAGVAAMNRFFLKSGTRAIFL